MRIPITINRNTLKTYCDETIKGNEKSTLQSGNFSQLDKGIPRTLQELCIDVIAGHWEEKQILDEIPLDIDRCLLLDILPTNLPLEITIPKIEDDIYWKRCYLERWPKMIPGNVPADLRVGDIVRVNNTSRRSSSVETNDSRLRKLSLTHKKVGERNWKDCYIEMHVRNYLEKLKPEEYDAERMKELSDLCGDYVKTLKIRELQCSETSANRIPLSSVLTGFKNLSELSICFKQIYVGISFSWNVIQVTLQDVRLLAKGLEKCRLTVFRLTNSDVDDDKMHVILKALLKHDGLHTLDFSHCKISDSGAVYLSKICLLSPIKNLILTNNKIGYKGIEAMCYAICHESCCLKAIDLKLNPITEIGGEYLIKALNHGARNIKNIFLSGCRLGKSNLLLGDMIENNTSLEQLDLSNNALGEEVGAAILRGLKYNMTLNKLDVRMCQINSETEFEILEKISKNRKTQKGLKFITKPIIIEPNFNFEISEELTLEIENIFQKTPLF